MFAEAVIPHHAAKVNPPLSTVGMLFSEPVKRQDLHVQSFWFSFAMTYLGMMSLGYHLLGFVSVDKELLLLVKVKSPTHVLLLQHQE